MLVTRYTIWDGRQRRRVDADRLFQELRRYLEPVSYTHLTLPTKASV
jgi:hypothetical protein